MSVLSWCVRVGDVEQRGPTARRVARRLPCNRNIHASRKNAPNAAAMRSTSPTSEALSCLLESGRGKTTKPLGKLAEVHS
jgi:hypothetical protein